MKKYILRNVSYDIKKRIMQILNVKKEEIKIKIIKK